MADYSVFQANLRGWLKTVWNKRADIMRAALSNAGRKEGAWLIYDEYNDPHDGQVGQFNLFCECLNDIATQYGVSAQPQTGKWDPTDFYHVEPPGYDGSKSKSRIYVNVKGRQKGDDTFMSQWSNALCVAYKVLDLRGSLAGFQKLKVSGPDMSPSRHDNVVIWLTGPDAVQKYLVEMIKDDFTQHYGATTPPATKQVRPGLAWADEPPETRQGSRITTLYGEVLHSFGSYLAGFIFLGLEQSYMATEQDYLDAVVAMFKVGGIDPKNAHRVSLPHREAKHKELLTNQKAVQMNLGTGSDSTSPLIVPDQLSGLKKHT